MKAEYRREMNHSYLLLKTDGEVNMQGYEMKMLLHNQLAGLLPLSVRYIDGVPLFYYEVTSRQSLLLNYEAKKFGKTDLERIFKSVADIMEELEEYLLDAETILFNPQYIYMDTDWQHFYFCCFPVSREAGRNGVLELTEYILPKIDHKDAEAVVLGYGVYRESVEAGIGADEIRRELRKVSMETADEKNQPENSYDGLDYSGEETITEEKENRHWMIFFRRRRDRGQTSAFKRCGVHFYAGGRSSLYLSSVALRDSQYTPDQYRRVCSGSRCCWCIYSVSSEEREGREKKEETGTGPVGSVGMGEGVRI